MTEDGQMQESLRVSREISVKVREMIDKKFMKVSVGEEDKPVSRISYEQAMCKQSSKTSNFSPQTIQHFISE